ncbi:hypothetical protein Clacol_001253 [Clathrus columnatus]|uniref:Uncharacterized protein n=1 Tax=Clathrus columnatus TaxID=1419009 RepID=A0AAV5A182_9AGAM|nr:hypothetical protein Clacol_001253 [Clathrus columnatus]
MSEFRTNPPKSIDDLTAALQNFAGTRSSSPDLALLECCCQNLDCTHLNVWRNVKAKLESRLVLSAEVGQALLQRYEAFVKRQDAGLSRQASTTTLDTPTFESSQEHIEYLMRKVDALTEENSIMESRIQELLIKTELSDAANRALQQELHETRTTINKLSVQHSKSVEWEMQLSQVTQERDDMREERDAAMGRARLAEIRAKNNADSAGKLQREMSTLKDELVASRASRNDFSQAVLQEAKSRVETLRRSLNVSDPFAHAQTARILESLVADNAALKKDVTELTMLLDEARDELQESREKWDEETRVNNLDDTLDFGMRYPRDKSVQTDSLLLSSNSNHPSHHPTFALPSPRPSVLVVESIGSSHSDTSSINQTDKERLTNGTGLFNDHKQDHVAPGTKSVPSSTTQLSIQPPANNFSAQDPQPITVLTNTLSTILTRLIQTDAKTLTLRLRRQTALSGTADPRSVSQTTIKGILNDIATLKLGRDSGLKWTIARAEVKAILRLFKDILELACSMRETLNEVTFEPTIANRLKREAFGADSDVSAGGSNGWIQKLFGPTATGSSSTHGSSSFSTSNAELRHPTPQRPSAKLAPAIAASAMTVNVLGPDARHGLVSADDILRASSPPALRPAISIGAANGTTVPLHAPAPRNISLMGIFAGAPMSASTAAEDKWVVLPRSKPESDMNTGRDKGVEPTKEKEKKDPDRLRQLRGAFSNISLSRSTTLAPGKVRGRKPLLSSHVDERNTVLYPTVDKDGHATPTDFREPLLQRTLRSRGLSDSSIRTTFLKEESQVSSSSHEDTNDEEEDTVLNEGRQRSTSIYLSPTSISMTPTPASSFTASPPRGIPRPSSARPGLMRNFLASSWVESSVLGSMRDDNLHHAKLATRRAVEGTDF